MKKKQTPLEKLIEWLRPFTDYSAIIRPTPLRIMEKAEQLLSEERQMVVGSEDWKQKLFDYMSQEFGFSILESDMNEIRKIILGGELYIKEANDAYGKDK